MKPTQAGRFGEEIRSDCLVHFTPRETGGREIIVSGKTKLLYGEQIKKAAKAMLDQFAIDSAKVTISDAGALPFTLHARLEAAILRAFPQLAEKFSPKCSPKCSPAATKNLRHRLRRSRLYLPGNEPKFMINAGLHNPDGIILDLEDSVAPAEKDAARILVRYALEEIHFHGAERMVRINPSPLAEKDLKAVIPAGAELILLPKCESATQVQQIEQQILAICEKISRQKPVYLMPIIESAKGVCQAYQIAQASKYNVALTIGLEDYSSDLGTERTGSGRESFYARSVIINAARACELQPIDSVFSDVDDLEGLKQSALAAKELGFEGQGCIHPRQVPVINDCFLPTRAEMEKAKEIVKAFEQAQAKGLAVVSLGSKMIDPPVVKRALQRVEVGLECGQIAENWREQ